jgi:hypothetical protein
MQITDDSNLRVPELFLNLIFTNEVMSPQTCLLFGDCLESPWLFLT